MNRQDQFREKYAQINPGWRDTQTLYKELLEKWIKPGVRVLDIGCGHSTFLEKAYGQSEETYGIDLDEEGLKTNNCIKNKVVADAEKLPFEDGFFDLVVSAWVVEHLVRPEKVFAEIHRVLKPGGKVVFLTPNNLNYNVWMIRMIPNRFHEWFTRKLYNRQKGDTFPVKYKMNSPGRIHRSLNKIGYRSGEIIFNGDPTYISFNKPLFRLATMLEKIYDLKMFKSARVHLLAIFEK